MGALAPLAKLLMTKAADPNSPAASDLVLALFNYRSGRPDSALETARRCSAETRNPALAAKASVLSALCSARIGKWDDAQTELDSVDDLINDKFNTSLMLEKGDLGAWRDWWVDHILLQEARGLFQEPPQNATR